MLRTRCLTLGARLVAPDILLGVYEYHELSEIENKASKLDDTPEFTAHSDVEN